MLTLRQFVEAVSRSAGAAFDTFGHVKPMWHIIMKNGTQRVLPSPPGSKDRVTAHVREVFKDWEAVRYAFIDEAWKIDGSATEGLTKAELYRIAERGLENYPGRVEVLMIQAEDENEGALLAERSIERPPIGPPRLGPLIVHEGGSSEGRFVGMLSPRGTKQ